MMDEKRSLTKCRLRVMKFDKNDYSSKHEMIEQTLKRAKGSRPRKRSRSPEPLASTTASMRKPDRKRQTRTVGTKPVNNNMVTRRSSSIAAELKRIFSNYSELNSMRDAHQVGDKAKKTRKKSKGKRKRRNLPDYLRHNDETATYNCETNKFPRSAWKESLRYPSMYYLSAGDSIEGEICKATHEPQEIDESCDCFITEITNRNASRGRDSISRRDNRKYSQDSIIMRADQGESEESCQCVSVNLNSTRHITRKKCNCKSGMPEHPTITCQTVHNIDNRVDGQTSAMAPKCSNTKCNNTMCNTSTSVLFKNVSCACPPPSNEKITRCAKGITTRLSKKPTPKTLPNTNNCAVIGHNSRALANDYSKKVTNKSPTSNTNLKSSQQGVKFGYSTCDCVPVCGNLPDQRHRMAGTESPSKIGKFKRLKVSLSRSFTGTPKGLVNVQTDCPAVPGPCSISDFSVQTGGTAESTKLCPCVSYSVDEKTNHPSRRSPLSTPKCISRDTSYLGCSKVSKTTQCEPPLDSNAVQTENASVNSSVSCESFDKPQKKKPSRRTRLKHKMEPFALLKKKKKKKKSSNVKTDKCNNIPKICDKRINLCADAEIGCLNDSCRGGPRRIQALFPPFFTRSACYIYYVIYIITMILCSPIVVLIYYCRFVTSPIRPSAGEICPPCIPPRPCPHVLVRLFKCRQWFDKPTVCSNVHLTLYRFGKIQKRPSLAKNQMKQHSPSSPACRIVSKTPHILTDCSVILNKCSISRSRVDQKIPHTAYNPASREDQIIPRTYSKPPRCEYQTIPSKCSKPTPCENQIIPTKYSKASSLKHEMIPSKYSKGSSRLYETIPRKFSTASSRGHEIIPTKSSKASSYAHELIPRKCSKASSYGHEIMPSKY